MERKGRRRHEDGGLDDGGSFLLETVNLISQHSSRNRKSDSVGAALSILCLAAQLDKRTAELITALLDALMHFFFLTACLPACVCVCVCSLFVFMHGLKFGYFWQLWV